MKSNKSRTVHKNSRSIFQHTISTIHCWFLSNKFPFRDERQTQECLIVSISSHPREEFSDALDFCFSFNRSATKDLFDRGNKHKISEKKERNESPFYQVFPAGRKASLDFFLFSKIILLEKHINFPPGIEQRSSRKKTFYSVWLIFCIFYSQSLLLPRKKLNLCCVIYFGKGILLT